MVTNMGIIMDMGTDTDMDTDMVMDTDTVIHEERTKKKKPLLRRILSIGKKRK